MPHCTLCKLSTTATHVNIPFRGSFSPKILFVGIAPGPNEDMQGENFIGPSGDLLRNAMAVAGIPADQVAYDNVVHCFPRDYMGMIRDPDIEEIMTCSPYLFNAIRISNPDVIVALGRIPWQVLTARYQDEIVGDFRGTAEVTEIAGKMRKVIGTYHPSAALRQRGKGKNLIFDRLVEDLKYAWEHAQGLYFLPKWRIINDTEGAVGYIEETVRRYRSGDIKFAAFDSETPQIVMVKLRERRKLGLELVSSDIWRDDKNFIGFSMSYIPPEVTDPKDVEGVFIPMFHRESKVDPRAIGNVLRWATDREGEVRLPLAFHNHKYDSQWLMEKAGSNPINYHDSMLGSFVYYGSSREHGLGRVAHRLLRYDTFKDETSDMIERMPAEERSFENLPLEALGRRGAIDAAATASLARLEKEMLQESQQEQITAVLNEFSELCAEMEWRGAAIDFEKQQQHVQSYPRLMDEVRARIEALPTVAAYIEDRRTRTTFNKNGKTRPPKPSFDLNPNSHDQKYELMYFYYNLPRDMAEVSSEDETDPENEYGTVYKTDELSRHPMTLHCRDSAYEGKCSCRCFVSGWETFDSGPAGGIIRTFSHHNPANYLSYGINPHDECYRFLSDLRFWSKLRKLYNDYLLKIERYFRPLEWQRKHQIPETLRVISFNYTLHYTKTGRLSTRDWPIHTEPWHSDVRRLHVSRWKDWGGLLLSADYSQLEVRIAAAIGRDPKLIEIYQKRQDVHRNTAAAIYQVTPDKVTSEMRRYAKTITFSIIYGGGAQAISDATGLPLKDSQMLLDGFYAEYFGIANSVENFHAFVKKYGYVTTMMNRIFYLPDIFSEDRGKQAGALRDSQNYTVQSPSSDITITAACMVRRHLRQSSMNSYIWALIHDAVESDLYPGELLSYYLTLKKAMEEDVVRLYDWICVPLEAEFELGVRWDGSMVVKNLDAEKMTLKGRRGWYDETMDVMSRHYQFNAKVVKEVYTGSHQGCGGEVDAATNKCSKCEKIISGVSEIDRGETLILKKSYEGETGGNTEVTAEIEWRQALSPAA